jgi:hypothetical protein
LIVYGEVFVRCDAFPPEDKSHAWVFKGAAGGLVGLLFAGLEGHVRSKDYERMLRETRRFQLTTTPLWTSVVFLDKHSKVLGNYQAGTIACMIGLSGGKGKWKRRAIELSLQEKTERALAAARKDLKETEKELKDKQKELDALNKDKEKKSSH